MHDVMETRDLGNPLPRVRVSVSVSVSVNILVELAIEYINQHRFRVRV